MGIAAKLAMVMSITATAFRSPEPRGYNHRPPLPADRNPALVYLASLAPGHGRPALDGGIPRASLRTPRLAGSGSLPVAPASPPPRRRAPFRPCQPLCTSIRQQGALRDPGSAPASLAPWPGPDRRISAYDRRPGCARNPDTGWPVARRRRTRRPRDCADLTMV